MFLEGFPWHHRPRISFDTGSVCLSGWSCPLLCCRSVIFIILIINLPWSYLMLSLGILQVDRLSLYFIHWVHMKLLSSKDFLLVIVHQLRRFSVDLTSKPWLFIDTYALNLWYFGIFIVCEASSKNSFELILSIWFCCISFIPFIELIHCINKGNIWTRIFDINETASSLKSSYMSIEFILMLRTYHIFSKSSKSFDFGCALL